MASTTTAIGDDSGGALHDRLPVRVGHIGDDHVAILEQAYLGYVLDDACRALAYLAADGAAFSDLVAGGGHPIARERIGFRFLRAHRFRTRLQYV